MYGLILACLLTAPRQEPQSNDGSVQPRRTARPQSPDEIKHVEALELYALGHLHRENDQLIEAIRLFEQALELQPQAAPIYQALIPLYLALGRFNDALTACRKTVELCPEDYTSWSIYARQLRTQGCLREARDALRTLFKSVPPAQHPEIRVQAAFDLGTICEQLHEDAQALDAYREVVKILDNPQILPETHGFDEQVLRRQAASVYEKMIRICIDQKNYDQAISFFEKAQSKYPVEAKRLNYVAAKIHFERGNATKALQLLQDHLNTQPRGVEGYELLCTILRSLGRGPQITAALERYAGQDAHNIALQLFLARQYVDAGRPSDAERTYTALLAQSPSPEIYQLLFHLYQNRSGTDGVVKVLETLDETAARAANKEEAGPEVVRCAARAHDMATAIRTDKELATAIVTAACARLSAGSRLHAETLYFLAALASRSRSLEAAELLYRRCLECPDARAKRLAAYSGLLEVLWHEHKHQEIAELCRQGLASGEAANQILFHLHLSQVCLILGKMEEAVSEATKAIEVASADRRLSARLNRVEVLSRADRFDESLAEASSLLKEYTQPGEVRDIRLRLANVYSSAGRQEKSEEQFQLILKADPNDATANNDLGYQWADQNKRLDEAERLIRKAIQLDTQQKKAGVASGNDEEESAAFLDSLGWVLFRRGRLTEAKEQLEKASALSAGAGDPVVWDHLGDVCFGLGERNRAAGCWSRALSFYEKGERRKSDPHYGELKRKLQELNSATRP
jgi:tetratricopeptide (TPR) repeat protein